MLMMYNQKHTLTICDFWKIKQGTVVKPLTDKTYKKHLLHYDKLNKGTVVNAVQPSVLIRCVCTVTHNVPYLFMQRAATQNQTNV